MDYLFLYNRSMKYLIFALIQCTWGFFQTLCGFVLFLIHRKEKHFYYKGAIVSEWKYPTSLSLGLFVFVTKQRIYIQNYTREEVAHRILVHEYGHTIQSLLLGPFYFLVIGIPSLLWCSLPFFETYRRKKNISYYSLYTEKWANYCGEKITKSKSMETIDRRRV